MAYQDIPGLIGVYKISGNTVSKIYGEDLKMDPNKLVSILMENMRIGEEEYKKLGYGPFLGFAMILDNVGIAYLNETIIVVDAVKTDWSKVLEELRKGVVTA
ncbi:hypothetical protein DFR86_01355 [Acidianus sulfidivorans JP7]|uniref:DUF2173 domain-containing protein n=1 Tax=Acidianus sulfidivorans JP7 TaxID=619593 RepID=A0A2U9IJX5_9CREN|nr:hypothetical protein [Acidianus sulfidivorans]AWR96323.1 hypothetical protein DFR86_01355 [Acidianus sulfidivorans JP7]